MFDALHIQMNEEAQHPVNFCSSLRASPEEEQRIAEMKESVTCNLRFAIEQVNQESESEYAKIDFSRLSDPPEPVQELEQQDHVYLGHPNDPSHWIERPKPKIAYYLQYTPTNPQPMQQPYYNARQQYYMTPEQQMAINNTAFYMRNRGPWSMNYVVNKAGPMTHPSQQRTRKWVDEYAQKMEKDLNDPVKLSQPLVEKKKNTAEALIGDGFVPAREGSRPEPVCPDEAFPGGTDCAPACSDRKTSAFPRLLRAWSCGSGRPGQDASGHNWRTE